MNTHIHFSVPRVCLVCGAWWVPRPPLCLFCTKVFFNFIPRQKTQRLLGDLHFQSLLPWSPRGPGAMAALAVAMKNSPKEDWVPFAEWFVERATLPENAVIVPAPPKRWGTKDHAWGWGWALSAVTGLPLCSPLVRVHTRSQKHLGRLARSQIRIDLGDPDWICSDYTSVILVDDIVTTGSTAKACYEAIGRPRRCVVWTLFDRTPCDAPCTLI